MRILPVLVLAGIIVAALLIAFGAVWLTGQVASSQAVVTSVFATTTGASAVDPPSPSSAPAAARQPSATSVGATIATPRGLSTSTAPSPASSLRNSPAATSTEAAPSTSAEAARTPTSAAPTAVGSAAASSSARAAVNDQFIEDRFDSSDSGWIVRETETWSAGYVDGRYQIVLNGQPGVSVSSNLPVQNYRVSLDVAVYEGVAGLVFLAAEPATFYRLMLTADGKYAIQAQQQGSNAAEYIVDWTESPLLLRDGASNLVQIERRGSEMRFFVNERPLTTWTIPAGSFSNQYGFALASRTAVGRATFDNLVGVRLPETP